MSVENTVQIVTVPTVPADDVLALLRAGSDVALSDVRIDGDLDLSLLPSEPGGEIRISSRIAFERVTFTGRIDTRLKPIRFLRPVTFKGASLSGCDFSKAGFADEVSFDTVNFNGIADFMAAAFGARATFFACEFRHPEGARFANATFDQASFLASRFTGVLRFQSARVNHHIDFDSASFLNTSYFTGSEFGSARFWNATFAGPRADFARVRVGSELSFDSSAFECVTSFTGASIDTLDLSHAIVRRRLSLLGCHIARQLRTADMAFDAPVDVEWAQVRAPLLLHLQEITQPPPEGQPPQLDPDAAWALARAELEGWAENFRRIGSNEDARAAGYEWTWLRRHRAGSSVWRRLSDVLLNVPSRRGTRPWRPVWVAIAIVLIFTAVLVWLQAATGLPVLIKGASTAPGYSLLLLSLEKFMPIGKPTLLGTWDVQPSVLWVLQIESLIGWAWLGLTAWSVRESFF